ncbi:MAG TPA: organic hydroperoxide resistance protein [Acidimicrobiales bacterium]|nr:organic hydroperoxide resistance protein [Acidimicrobiales bacterium]
MNVLYTAEATAWGGRNGRAASSDGSLDVTLVPPKELGGTGAAGTNPEQLFAAGYAGCFHSALTIVARGAGVPVDGSAVTARVGLGTGDGGGFGLAVELLVEMPDVERAVAEDLVAKAHAVCPYSNATRGNIDVKLGIVD